ncbi:unnamed protein product, partial [Symbiodinium sp. KB8]
ALSGIDPQALISRDVTDEEVLAYTKGHNDPNDPDGIHLFGKFTTNQLVSKLIRGAVQMGYKRTNFDPRNHMHDDHQGEAGEAKFVDKSNKNRVAQQPPHARALTHITPDMYTQAGQISILNMPVTEDEVEAVAKAKAKAKVRLQRQVKDQDVNSEFNNDEVSRKVHKGDMQIAADGVMIFTVEHTDLR